MRYITVYRTIRFDGGSATDVDLLDELMEDGWAVFNTWENPMHEYSPASTHRYLMTFIKTIEVDDLN